MDGGSLTNKQVHSIYKGNGSLAKKVTKVLIEYGKTENDVNASTVRTRIKNVALKVKNLQKKSQKKAELAEYLEQTFALPLKDPHATPRIQHPKTVTDSETAVSVNTDLAAELANVREQLQNSDAELAHARLTILQLKQFQPSRLNQTIKRHKESLAKQKLKVAKLKGELKAAVPPKPRVRPKKKESDRVLRCQGCAHIDWSVKFRLDELKTLKERIKALEYEKTTLEDQLKENKLQSSSLIRSRRDGKKYTVELRQVIHLLVKANVAVTKLETVIRTVLTHLTDKDIDRFPDSKTCRSIIREMDMASAFKVASELSMTEKKPQDVSMTVNNTQGATSNTSSTSMVNPTVMAGGSTTN